MGVQAVNQEEMGLNQTKIKVSQQFHGRFINRELGFNYQVKRICLLGTYDSSQLLSELQNHIYYSIYSTVITY